MSGRKLLYTLSIMGSLFFVGCSGHNYTQEKVSDSSMNLIMNYSKKTLPEGYVWNFGVGKNYSSALEDASQSLTFEQATTLETKVIVSNKERIISDQYGNKYYTAPTKIMETKGNNKYNIENKCDIHKLLNTSDGILIIRICKNTNLFEEKIKKARENSMYKQKGKIHEMHTINLFFHSNQVKGHYNEEDKYAISSFLKEITYLDDDEIWWNFPSNDPKDIENFVLTSYKSWNKHIPISKERRINHRIYYPWQWQKCRDSHEREPSQLWTLKGNNIQFSLAKKLTAPQLMGFVKYDDFFKELERVK